MSKPTTFKPMTDDDVAELHRAAAKIDQDVLMKLFNDFSNTLISIIRMNITSISNVEDKMEIERIKRIVLLCPIEERFYRCKDKIWNVRDHIINKNAAFFLERDYSEAIKADQKQAMIENIVEIVKNNYSDRTEKEKAMIWQRTGELLKKVIEFNQLIEKTKNTS